MWPTSGRIIYQGESTRQAAHLLASSSLQATGVRVKSQLRLLLGLDATSYSPYGTCNTRCAGERWLSASAKESPLRSAGAHADA